MARRPRLNMAGFHHIVNRGVARDKVYKCDEDKEKYLEILCKACKTYKVNVHDYCLMDNHYHLLIETTSENLYPIEAKISKKIGEYQFTLLATVLRDDLEIIPCAKHSQIKKEIEYEGIREHLELALEEQELKELEIRQKKKIVQKEYSYGHNREQTFQEHFEKFKNKNERNEAIIRALNDGYNQAEIARYLNLSASAVAKVRKKFE